MSRGNRWSCGAAAATLALVTLAVVPSLALPAAAASEPEVVLSAQAPVVGLGADFAFDVRGTNIEADTTLRTTIYERVVTRSAFDRMLDGRNFGATIARATTALPAGSTTTTITLPLYGSATPGPTLNITQVGVYPVRVESTRVGGPVREAFTTFLVTTPASTPPVGEPLEVATVVSIQANPAVGADGNVEPKAVEQRTPAGTLGRLVSGVARQTQTPMTLSVGGETIASWAGLAANNREVASTLGELQRAATAVNVVPSTFVPIDAPSLRAAGFGDLVADEYARGFDAVGDALQTRVDARTAIPTALDAGTLELLGTRGIDQLVVDPLALQPIAARLTPARPFLLNSADRQFRAIAFDRGLAAATATPGSVARAQRLLAGMTLVALEAPNVRRGIAVALPADLDADAAFYDTLFVGLRTSPFLKPATVDRLFEDVPLDATTAGPLERNLAPAALSAPTITSSELDRSRAHAAAIESILGPQDARVVMAKNALVIAPTSLWTDTAGRRRAADELARVDRALSDAAKLIRAPANRTFQLTGRKDRIPLTFVNDADRAVQVRVIFDGSRIAFPDGADRVIELPANRSTTISVPVEPRTSGTYPFRLVVQSVDGNVQLASSRLTVNATAVSGAGLFLAGGAGLFLAAWWGRYAWKRRKRRPVPSAPTPVTEPLERSA
ncbi:MAG: DUF6049 family protein [Acidimicrobiia bacterium]